LVCLFTNASTYLCNILCDILKCGIWVLNLIENRCVTLHVFSVLLKFFQSATQPTIITRLGTGKDAHSTRQSIKHPLHPLSGVAKIIGAFLGVSYIRL
ncbi:hypothetical protein, partial [Dulcicalothrix desertica]|uniref:hypothetical protein n=1 Tax=Dulcicalothrix desertica TaxID=32056 RepID=UPI001F45F362